MPDLTSLGPLSLLVIMAIVFAETGLLVGFFLPGDSLLFTAGVLAATGALPVPFWAVAVGVFAAAGAGDQVGYLLGRQSAPGSSTVRTPGCSHAGTPSTPTPSSPGTGPRRSCWPGSCR